MPVNATIVKVADLTGVVAANAVSIPIRTGERGVGGERFAAGKRVLLSVLRSGNAGSDTFKTFVSTIKVMGADLPQPYAGAPVGNAYVGVGQAATAVRPQKDVIPADGSTTAFTTNIDLASGDLAAAIASSSYAILVDSPAFRLAQDSSLAAITGTMTAAGVITTSAAFDTALKGGVLAAGDTLLIGGVACTVTSASGTTINTDATTAVSTASPIYVTTKSRRFQKVMAASAGTASNDVEATVSNSKLVLTFKVAPPAFDRAPVPSTQTPGAGAAFDPVTAYLVTPTEILADGLNQSVRVGIRSRSVMWTIVGTAQIAGDRTLVTVEHGAE